jgi:tetratricopeptide (TPR) repeat protein
LAVDVVSRALCVLCGLSSCVLRGNPSAAAVYEANFRGLRPAAASHPPVDGLPTPAWYQVSGKWRRQGGGLLAEAAGELRSDALDVGRSGFRVGVWADVSGAADTGGPLLRVAVRDFHAGLFSAGRAFVRFGEDTVEGRLWRPVTRGRFLLIVEVEDGLVSVRTRRNRGIKKRDVFRRWIGSGHIGVSVHAGAGVVVYAVRVRTFAGRERPEALAAGDGAWSGGQAVRAGALYSEALADDGLLPCDRAETAYKLGLVIRRSEPTDALRAFDRAQRLNPEGPWGERARLEFARAALESGNAALALAFAHRLATNAAGNLGAGIEEWEGFRELVSAAREKLVAARQGARATGPLRIIAQYLEWAGSPRERALWAWNEVALSYSGRGWHAEAAAVRDRAERVLGKGGLPRGRYARFKPKGGRSNGAPSILPEPEADRLLREKRERRARTP